MIVQWCVKGLNLANDTVARDIIDGRGGLVCNWWRRVGQITPAEQRDRLNPNSIDMHVNQFTTTDPATGRPFSEDTPFISLSAGTVERDAVAKTNLVHRARRTALFFGTDFGRYPKAYLFICWVVLAPRSAIEIEGVAEEIRDLNTYRRYSPFQSEGEIAAKIIVPDNQIHSCEKWEIRPGDDHFHQSWASPNPRFTPPERLSNVRELI
jgi:hypothetical protein